MLISRWEIRGFGIIASRALAFEPWRVSLQSPARLGTSFPSSPYILSPQPLYFPSLHSFPHTAIPRRPSRLFNYIPGPVAGVVLFLKNFPSPKFPQPRLWLSSFCVDASRPRNRIQLETGGNRAVTGLRNCSS